MLEPSVVIQVWLEVFEKFIVFSGLLVCLGLGLLAWLGNDEPVSRAEVILLPTVKTKMSNESETDSWDKDVANL